MEGLPGTAPAHSEKSAQEMASGGLGAPTREGMWAETGQPVMAPSSRAHLHLPRLGAAGAQGAGGSPMGTAEGRMG